MSRKLGKYMSIEAGPKPTRAARNQIRPFWGAASRMGLRGGHGLSGDFLELRAASAGILAEKHRPSMAVSPPPGHRTVSGHILREINPSHGTRN